MASINSSSIATTVNNILDKASAPTTTNVTLPGGSKFRLVGQSDGFNASQIAELAENQEETVKVIRKATEDESDIVANGGSASRQKSFGGETGGKLSVLAAAIRAASGKPTSAPKTTARTTAPAPSSNGATP